MQIRSIRDIPDEIKNVVELYYAGSQSAAYSEAESLRAVRKDLRELADCVLQLFEHAPGSMFAFYDSLIAVSSTSLSTEGFDFGVSNLMGDDDDGFSMLLTQSLEDDTKLPSVFTDSSDQHRSANKSFGLSGQKLSSQPPKFGTDISLDIDIDIDPSTYSDSMASAFSQKAVSSAPFSQQPPPRLTPLSDASSSSLGKAAPSIMRAAQKSLQHEDSRNAKRLAEITKPRAASSSPSGVLTPPSVPSSANQDATPLARKRTSGQADTHATVLNLTPIAVPEPHTASSRYTSASDQAATRPPS
ncbi:MAG: hypothetical protein FWC40_07525, partial [Proteobacteria bacterium]|nr:hypothetical protein [Pseudomonadota bacterium]